MNTHTYGWKPDVPDIRDFKYSIEKPIILPRNVDLRPVCPSVYDQGQLGSCTANAIAGALQCEQIKQNIQIIMPSRLFIYYNERVIEHDVFQDNGAQIRDGMISINKQGVCSENTWQYNINLFAKRPFPKCYTEALKHKAIQYSRVQRDLKHFKTCLASGFPFVFGFTVYSSFESEETAKTGFVPMPDNSEQSLGGHAVLAVGYDDSAKMFIVRNSWGVDWAMKGYFMLPYDYLLNSDLSDDFWKLKLIE